MDDSPLPTTTRCPTCGATCPPSAPFCGSCGMPLQAGPTSMRDSQPATPLAALDQPPAPAASPDAEGTFAQAIPTSTARAPVDTAPPSTTGDGANTPALAPTVPAAPDLGPASRVNPPSSQDRDMPAQPDVAQSASSDTALRCQWCGAENPAGSERCQQCGAAFPNPEQDAALLRASRERVRQAEDYISTVRTARGWSLFDIFRRKGKRPAS